MSTFARAAAFALAMPLALFAQAPVTCSQPASFPTTRVGPPSATVIVVGGGSLGPEIYREFITAAGGPDATIITVPNSGGAETYDQSAGASQAFRRTGARAHSQRRRARMPPSVFAISARPASAG